MSVVFRWRLEDFDKLVANCPSEPVAPFIFKYMPKDGLILEAGCGSGRFVYFLAQLGYSVVGIELGADTVKVLNEKFPQLDIRIGDVRQLPFEDESLDGIISLGVIEHVVEGIDGPIKEMYRTLKSGRYAIVIVPSFNPIRQFKYWLGLQHVRALLIALKRLNFIRRVFGKSEIQRTRYGFGASPLGRYRRWPIWGEFYEYRFRKEEFENELKNAGFDIVETVPTSHIDGLFHEFGRLFVRLSNHTFYPYAIGNWLNSLLSRKPFFHNHMHLCVVQKRSRSVKNQKSDRISPSTNAEPHLPTV